MKLMNLEYVVIVMLRFVLCSIETHTHNVLVFHHFFKIKKLFFFALIY